MNESPYFLIGLAWLLTFCTIGFCWDSIKIEFQWKRMLLQRWWEKRKRRLRL